MMKVHESAENYLETILILTQRNGSVRGVDIARELDFSKASVSVAMGRLKQENLIAVDSGGYISLLPQGLAIAEQILERHSLLSEWLIHLGVSPETAAEDACRIEHVISQESFDALKNHANRLRKS